MVAIKLPGNSLNALAVRNEIGYQATISEVNRQNGECNVINCPTRNTPAPVQNNK